MALRNYDQFDVSDIMSEVVRTIHDRINELLIERWTTDSTAEHNRLGAVIHGLYVSVDIIQAKQIKIIEEVKE